MAAMLAGVQVLCMCKCITMNIELFCNDMADADTINTFMNCLDKYWSNQDVLLNFNTDLTETASLPICM